MNDDWHAQVSPGKHLKSYLIEQIATGKPALRGVMTIACGLLLTACGGSKSQKPAQAPTKSSSNGETTGTTQTTSSTRHNAGQQSAFFTERYLSPEQQLERRQQRLNEAIRAGHSAETSTSPES